MRSLSLFILLSASAFGADPASRSPREIAEAAAPYLNERVIGLIHVSPDRIDSESMARSVGRFLDQADTRHREWQAAAMKWREASATAGLRDIFMLLTLDDPNSPAVFVLCFDSSENRLQSAVDLARPLWGAAELLSKSMWPRPSAIPSSSANVPAFVERLDTRTEMIADGSRVLIGSSTALRRLKAKNSKPRPELQAALESIRDSDVQAVFIPTNDQRRIFEEFYPTLPSSAGGGSVGALSRGLQWASAGVRFKDAFSISVRAESENPTAARELADRAPALLSSLARTLLRQDQAPFESSLKFTASDRQIRLESDGGKAAEAFVRFVVQFQRNAENTNRYFLLRALAVALHNYASANGKLPQRAIRETTQANKPLLSWRVSLLPFLGEEILWREFHLNEPWDSEHNKKLIPRMPNIYRSDIAKFDAEFKTRILVPVGPRTIFTPNGPGISLEQIAVADGTSMTIMVVEASEDEAVVWTKPDDWEMAMTDESLDRLFGHRENLTALFADGVPRVVPRSDRKNLELLLIRDDGQTPKLPPQAPH